MLPMTTEALTLNLEEIKFDPEFSGANGHPVTVTFISEIKIMLLFPKQKKKANLYFEGSGQERKAIVDWTGSLEAK
ncbi:MAG: hypothetical protein RBT11_19360 [Desulfobacterales bacterium]|jgi:hypothetical protein|nr:hypothetical protein [Desulfobacterales bacterium]